MISNWHNISAKETAKILGSDIDVGLTREEVLRRRAESGRNMLPQAKTSPRLGLFLEQFKSPLIYILLVAGVVVLFLGDYGDAIGIFIALILNTLIGYIQENKASKALRGLREIVEHQAEVIREGAKKIIDSVDMVLGDIFILKPGDRVPADARIIKSKNLKINEMALTGEWLGAKKIDGILDKATPMADRENMVYMGTIVEEGTAKAITIATNGQTEMGQIAVAVREAKEGKTPYQKKLSHFSKIVGLIIVLLSAVIFIEGLLVGRGFIEMFTVSVAVAVAAIPEGLPVAMTVILALGMQRILKKKGLVRKLVATETLGSTSVICTDKTGTLTQGKIKVTKVICKKRDQELVSKISILCNEAFVEPTFDSKEKEIIRGRPTDKALLSFGIEKGISKQDLIKELPQIDNLLFDNRNKFLATLHKSKKGNILFVSGAPEVILAKSKLSPVLRKKWETDLKHLAGKGFRTIAFGLKETKSRNIKSKDLEELRFVALLGLSDPLREDAKQSLKVCRQAGMRVVMITGDHRLTAKFIAKKLGFKTKKENIMEGIELDALSDEQLAKKLKKIQIFARTEPRHKIRIVQSWQEAGEVVAMTGDGINDAPALKQADIGVAFGSGTEVAKEISDLILLDNSFSVIVSAVEQGRVVLDNIRKVITYLLSDSFTEVILIGGSMIIAKAFNQPVLLPLTALQILWVNFIEDGLPNIALAFEPQEKDIMKQQPGRHKLPLLTREMKVIIFAVGIITDLILLAIFFWFWRTGLNPAYIKTMIFGALSIDSIFYVFSCKSLRKGLFHENIFSNKLLIASWFFSVFALVIAIYVPVFSKLLKTVPLRLFDWLILFGIGMSELIFIELAKHYFIVRHETQK